MLSIQLMALVTLTLSNVIAVDRSVKTTNKRNIKDIRSIADKCNSDNVCSDFQYDDVDTIGFFEISNSELDDKRIKEQQNIRFENSTFAQFPLNLFNSLNLRELDMRNCSMEVINWENFLFADHLRVLLLSNNNLQKIDELTFNYANNLEYLWLDNNRIQTLVSESFKGLKRLKYLSLDNNSLHHLPEGVFDDLLQLQELILSRNHIQILSNDLFINTSDLFNLILNANQLRNISDYAFRTAGGQLTNLDISDNRLLRSFIVNLSVKNLAAKNCALRQVDIYGFVLNADLSGNRILELYFSQPEVLEELVLKNNSLQQIASLTKVNSLRELDLSDNPQLKSLPSPWSVSSLKILNLSNTGITAFPSASLSTLNQLKFLDISKNKIQEIHISHFQQLMSLTKFYIHQNDWNCFNLKLLMDLVIKAEGIAYIRDHYNDEFLGEYVEGIQCMYRLLSFENEPEYLIKTKERQTDPLVEVENLRKELRAIVTFYEEKFSKTFKMINNLKARLDEVTAQNESFWNHVTITT